MGASPRMGNMGNGNADGEQELVEGQGGIGSSILWHSCEEVAYV